MVGNRSFASRASRALAQDDKPRRAVRKEREVFVRSERACHPERPRREGSVDSRTPHSTLPWDRDAPGTNPKPEGARPMRFMMLVIPKGYEKAAADFAPPADLVAKMTKYNESLTKAGVLLGLDGLTPPAKGARVSFGGGKTKVTDGPFTEAKEVLGGYWMIQVKSRAEAIEWAKRAPMLDGDIIEVRQVQELSDLPHLDDV